MAVSIDKGSKSSHSSKTESKSSTPTKKTEPKSSSTTKSSTSTPSSTSRFKDSFARGTKPSPKVSLGGSSGTTASSGSPTTGLKSGVGGAAKGGATTGGPTVTTDTSGRTVVDLGTGNNKATVSQAADGSLSVTSDGTTVTLTPEESRRVTVQGGAGNDEIQVQGDVTVDLRIEGGAGNDTLRGGDGKDTLIGGAGNDTITGGKGNDYVSGGDGEDYIEGGEGDDLMSGGAGRDTMYGLDGKDTMLGGADQDYMDGGRGDDRVSGGDGNDVLFGGQGRDSIGGGKGDDVIAGGAGIDRTAGGEGADTTYYQRNDVIIGAEAVDSSEVVDLNTADGTQLGHSITVQGSPEFQARVQSDLDALRSIPSGREMLAGLDNSGHTTTIVQQAPEDGNKARPANRDDAEYRPNGDPGPGTDATILYHPERSVLGSGAEDWMVRPPMVGLYHEMVHAYNYTTGTLLTGTTHQDAHGVHGASDVNNLERAAVGLPYDDDGDAATPGITANHVNENQIREELGLPTRPHY